MDAAFMKYSSVSEQAGKKKAFSTPFNFLFITSLSISFLLFVFKNQTGAMANIPAEYSHLIIYVILILLIDSITIIPFANLRLEKKAKKFAAIRIANIVINLALNIILILVYKLGVEAIFISNLAASLFSLIVLLPEIIKNYVPVINKVLLKKLLKFGIPYLPGSLAAMMVQMIDVPIMRELTNDSTVGIYRANYKLGIFMMLFVSMFQFAWQPFFLENAKEKNAKEIFSKVLTLFLFAGGIIWLLLTLFIEDIAQIEILNGRTLLGTEYLEGLIIVPLVLLGYLFYGLYINFTAGIYIEEKTNYFPIVTGTGAVINIGVNLLLIPIYGMIGAAVATLVSYLIMASGLYIVSQKFYPIEYEIKKVVVILADIFFVAAGYYYFLWNNSLNFFIKILLLLAFIAILILFRAVTKKDIQSGLKIIMNRN
jgi:O-antigen/teichoic acid export membrane protein